MVFKCFHCHQDLVGVREVFSAKIVEDELILIQAIIDGKAFSHTQLYRIVFGNVNNLKSERNSLAQLVSRTNRKIAKTGYKIVSVHGQGYQLFKRIM